MWLSLHDARRDDHQGERDVPHLDRVPAQRPRRPPTVHRPADRRGSDLPRDPLRADAPDPGSRPRDRPRRRDRRPAADPGARQRGARTRRRRRAGRRAGRGVRRHRSTPSTNASCCGPSSRPRRPSRRPDISRRALQQILLPPGAAGDRGLDIAAAYRPAGQGDEVGGDFYDVFEAASGEWAVVIGDVCGKGVEAALVTARARYAIRAAAPRLTKPGAVLAAVNRTLVDQALDRFCTVAARVPPPDRRTVDADRRVRRASVATARPARPRPSGRTLRVAHRHVRRC